MLEIINNNPGPGNVESIRTPALNKEWGTLDPSTSRRDKKLRQVQDLVTGSLSVVSNLMSDLKDKTKPMDRAATFRGMADMARLLSTAHKDLSQTRRESLRVNLSNEYKILATFPPLQRVLDNNKFLFGDDTNKRAEETAKARKLSSKLQTCSKNGGQRGRTTIPHRPLQTYKGKGDYHPTSYPYQPRGDSWNRSKKGVKRPTSQPQQHQQAKFRKH